MITRRRLSRTVAAITCAAVPMPSLAQHAGAVIARSTPAASRGTWLIRNGAVITVDPALGTLPRADILVQEGAIAAIGERLQAPGAEVIDATDMIVMPGLIDTHYHMWSALGRNFTGDGGFGYFAAKNATSPHYTPEDSYASVLLGLAELANAGITTVHNWSNNTRSPAHADAELQAHRDSLLRARFAYGHPDLLDREALIDFADIVRVRREWFGDGAPFEGLVHLGVNLRGMSQSAPEVFHHEMAMFKSLGLPGAIHAGQSPPNINDAADYERRGYLGPDLLICHYVVGSDEDFAAMARTRTPLSFATHSELRLGRAGDPRAALMRMRKAGLTISLSCDASSLAPPNMLELMRVTWNIGVPWQDTQSAGDRPIQFAEVIRMGTINGAVALGLGEITGSLTPGKRADLILIRTTDINMAPMGVIETSVVQSATAANIDTVMVDGRILKRGGRLVAFDVPRIVAAARAASHRIRAAAGGVLTPFVCADCGG